MKAAFALFGALMMLMAADAAGYHISRCENVENGIYMVQYPETPDEIYSKLYSSRGSDVLFESFREEKGFSDGAVFGTGDEFCIDSPIDEIYDVREGDTFWRVWEKYGAARGMTFSDLVNGYYGASLPVEADPYAINRDRKDLKESGITSIRLGAILSKERREGIYDSNLKLLDALESSLSPANMDDGTRIASEGIANKREHVFDLTGRYDTSKVEEEIADSAKGSSMEFGAVIVPKAMFDESSLSLGGISDLAHRMLFTGYSPGDLVAVILEGEAVALSYPANTYIDDIDRHIFDDIIEDATKGLRSKNNAVDIISGIHRSALKGELLSEKGVEYLAGDIEMNGNPIITDYETQKQDLDWKDKRRLREIAVHILPKCGKSFKKRLDFCKDLKSSIEKKAKEVHVYSGRIDMLDSSPIETCITGSEMLKALEMNGPQDIFIVVDSGEEDPLLRYASDYGGVLADFVKGAVGDDFPLDLERAAKGYSLLSSPEQVSVEIRLRDSDLDPGLFDILFGDAVDKDGLAAALESFAEWRALDAGQRGGSGAGLKRSADETLDSLSPDYEVRELIAKIIEKGSRYARDSRSPAGCRGILQLCSSVAREYPKAEPLCDPVSGCRLGYDNRDDAEKSLRAGVEYFTDLIAKYKDKRTAAAAYFGGESLIDEASALAGGSSWEAVKEYINAGLMDKVYCSGCSGYFADPEVLDGLAKKVVIDTESLFQG